MYSLYSLGLYQFNTEAMFCHDAIINSPASQFMLISAKFGVLSFIRATLYKILHVYRFETYVIVTEYSNIYIVQILQ